jgi:hypothetical protein
MQMPKTLDPVRFVESQNLHNSLEKNNKSRLNGLFAYLILGMNPLIILFSLAVAHEAGAIPVELNWQVRLNPGNAYTVEISADKGFSEVVATAPIRGPKFYKWEAPSEGVYHWRLLRPKTIDGAERNTFLSGTFTVIDSSLSRKKPAILKWEGDEKADRYKIYVLEGDVKRRIMVTKDNRFFIPKMNVNLVLEVVPFVGGQRINQFMHFDPTMELDPGTEIKKPMPAVAVVVPDPQLDALRKKVKAKKEPREKAEEVEKKKVKEEPKQEKEVPLNYIIPVHQVSIFAYFVEEDLHAQKLEIDLISKEQLPGGGAWFWTNPFSGLVISGSGMYHDHAATISQSGGEEYEVLQGRFTSDFSLGWNLLNNTKMKNQQLTLSLLGASVQLPRLPLEFSGSPSSSPNLEKQQYNMPGASMRYDYFASNWAGHLEGGAAVLEEEGVKISWQKVTFQYFANTHLTVDLGAFARLSSSESCHETEATCEIEGKVNTTSKESGITLGLGTAM